jgi:hypothetical protein
MMLLLHLLLELRMKHLPQLQHLKRMKLKQLLKRLLQTKH